MAENGIAVAKNKAQWVQPNEAAPRAVETPKERPATEIDSIESLNKKPVEQQQGNSPGFWATVWSKFCSLFGYSTAPTTQAGQGGGTKAEGGSVTPVASSPTLQAPYMFDLIEFTKLLKETRDSLHQVQEINNEADEENRKSEDSKRWLVEYLKANIKIYEEGAMLAKKQTIRHQEELRAVRKKMGDTKTEAAESAANEKFWGRWNNVARVALLVSTVAFIAVSAAATGGLSIPAVIAAIPAVASPLSGALTGITSIMRGTSTKQMNDRLATVQTLSHLNQKFSQLKIPADMLHMKQSLDSSLQIVTEQLKRLEEKDSHAKKSMIAGISGG